MNLDDYLDDYLELRGLFSNKWDPVILGVLDGRPLRFLALIRGVRATTGEDLPDRTVARSLDRLEQAGYIHAETARRGRSRVTVYSLTALGTGTLRTYQAVLDTYHQTRGTDPASRTTPTAPTTPTAQAAPAAPLTRATPAGQAGPTKRRP